MLVVTNRFLLCMQGWWFDQFADKLLIFVFKFILHNHNIRSHIRSEKIMSSYIFQFKKIKLNQNIKSAICDTPLTQVFLSSGSNPPWIIANRFCSAGLACAAIHLSNQRIERNMASSTLGPKMIIKKTSIVSFEDYKKVAACLLYEPLFPLPPPYTTSLGQIDASCHTETSFWGVSDLRTGKLTVSKDTLQHAWQFSLVIKFWSVITLILLMEKSANQSYYKELVNAICHIDITN